MNVEIATIIEACGSVAARNMGGLSIYFDLTARKNTLLHIEKRLEDEIFGASHVQKDYRGKRVKAGIEEWAYSCGNQDEMADRLHYFDCKKEMLKNFGAQRLMVQHWLRRLDSNNTIDQKPDWSAEFRRYQRDWPVARLYAESGLERLCGKRDGWSRYLERSTRQARYSEYLQRLDIEVAQAFNKRWFIVFDTLTIDPFLEDKFFDNETCIRDHVRRIGRLVNEACGEKKDKSYDQNFRYFAVPEYGKKKGRLHFHFLYLMRKLPNGCVDPNIGRRVRNAREIRRLKLWDYGYSSPIAVRYSGDPFSDLGWLWPVDKKGKPLECKPVICVCKYVTKYVTKSQVEKKKWLMNQMKMEKEKRMFKFRIRMTRNFGLNLNLSKLSPRALLEMICLHHSVTRKGKLLRRIAKRNLSWKLASLSMKNYLDQRPMMTPLLEQLRDLTASIQVHRRASLDGILTKRLRRQDISNELREWLDKLPRCDPNRLALAAK